MLIPDEKSLISIEEASGAAELKAFWPLPKRHNMDII
jgi:hypothetical protein